MQAIIFQNNEGGVSITYPSNESLTLFSIDEIARRSVPIGKPYKIIDKSEIPEDKSQRFAWTIDEALLTDGVGECLP